MSRASDLRKRQRESDERVLDRVAETRDAPRLTIEQLRELVEAAKAAGEETIEITVRRWTPTKRHKPILLVFFEGEKRRVGPPSSSDHAVEPAGGHNWRARWRVRDCEIVLSGRPGR